MSFVGSCSVTTGQKICVELEWGGLGGKERWRGRQKSLSVPASEAPTECSDWPGSLFRPGLCPSYCRVMSRSPVPCECLRYRLR